MKKAYEVWKAIYERTPDQKIRNLVSKIPWEILKIIESKIDDAIEEEEYVLDITINEQISCSTKKVKKFLELHWYKSVKINPESETTQESSFSIHFEIPKYSSPSSLWRRD